MIPLPKLIWPYKDEECQLLSLAEIKDLQREAMREALEHAATQIENTVVHDDLSAWNARAVFATDLRALRIEGDQQ